MRKKTQLKEQMNISNTHIQQLNVNLEYMQTNLEIDLKVHKINIKIHSEFKKNSQLF